MLIKNLNLANYKLIIGEAEPIKFDESGKAEIAPELGQKLLKLKGYELVEEDKKSESGADKKEKEPKETALATGTVEVEGIDTEEGNEKENKEEINPEEDMPDYEALTTKELKDLIKEKGEKAPSGATKAELVEILKNLEK